MTTKSLKRFAELLNRSEGISIAPIIVIMVIMSVMGGVFTSIMGSWKVSAPLTVNSNKAFFLAESAAMFALQDAKYRFLSKDTSSCPDFPACGSGTRSAPFVVSNVESSFGTETAEFWVERPYPSANTIVDEYPAGTDRGNNDDDDSGSDDDVYDDDLDDSVANNTLYTIIATGKILRDGTTVAKRQIKIKANVTDNSASAVEPGIHTEGSIRGSGSGAFNVWQDGVDITAVDSTVEFASGTYADSSAAPSDGSRTLPVQTIYQTPADSVPTLDEEFFKIIAADQGHYNPTVVDNYPNGSYYYDTPTNTMPNITYISGDLSPCNNKTIYGIYWVKGDISLGGNWQVNGIIICEGDVKMNGGGSVADPNMDGGIIQYGNGNELWAAGNPSIIQINDIFFNAMNATIPSITIQSWQEAVSAN